MRRLWPLLVLVLSPALAELTPAQVGLLVNRNDPASATVAEHYRRARQVPAENVLAVGLPPGETLPREVYQTQLLPAVRSFLIDRGGRLRCLLLIYGMPLRVGQRVPTPEQKAEADRLKPELDAARAAGKANEDALKELRAKPNPTAAEKQEIAAKQAAAPELAKRTAALQEPYARASGSETNASLEGELALAWWPPFELYRWVFNTQHFGFPAEARSQNPPVLMTARLDGPTPEIAQRLVDDAIRIEREGLKGKAYIDARGIKNNPNSMDWYGYAGYDDSLRDLATLLREKARLEVVLNDEPRLFQPGECPDAALYCGWYSLANYVDAFTWAPGAVAYHIASSEAVTLRGDSNQWCRKMLDKGVAATLGPVNEPYTIGFPKPYEFFANLLTGEWTLAEVYSRTLFLQSWMTSLIGDPLYNPYRGRALLTTADIRPSPAGAPLPWTRAGREATE
ncbi:MAG: TIGR03790 family protein [Fimbriimonadaceae bacterium]|nr:TIGR03790 family protein [Fimbriimonadaceae bacterium]